MANKRLAIVAFEGWNDAGEAATGAIDHLIDQFNGQVTYRFDPEPYYDFQVNRPFFRTNSNGEKVIEWRTTSIYRTDPINDTEIYLVRGIEPSMHWRAFTEELVMQIRAYNIDLVVALGALLSDTPHSRPTPVTPVAMSKKVSEEFGVDLSDYEGPTGILGVLQESLMMSGVPGLSLWAAVPHYVSQPPSPKATMSLLDSLDDLTELNISLGDLPQRADAWLAQVVNLVESDEEMADYVRRLEQEGDQSQLPIASGESIAKEFERYLRRREAN